MMRALLFGTASLVAVDCLVLGTPSAFATTCSSLLPGTSLSPSEPSGDSFGLSGPSGLLNGATFTYAECTAGAVNYIPFYEPAAAAVNLALTGSTSDNAKFTFTVYSVTASGVSKVMSYTGTTSASGDISNPALLIDVPGGLDALAIDDYGLHGGSDSDYPYVALDFENYIPEPASLGLFGLSAACLIGLRRRKQRQTA